MAANTIPKLQQPDEYKGCVAVGRDVIKTMFLSSYRSVDQRLPSHSLKQNPQTIKLHSFRVVLHRCVIILLHT